MTGAWSAHGARCRGALSLLVQFQSDGRRVWVDPGGVLIIDPADDLAAGDFHTIRNLKPEVLAWLAFTPHQRSVLAPFDPDLQQLRRYRDGLEIWLRFTPEEQSRMIGLPWTPEALRAVADLKEATGGTIQEAAWADPAS